MRDTGLDVQRHGFFNLFSTFGTTIIGFFSTMFFAHWLGEGVLGIYFSFLAYFGILSFFTDFGIGVAGVKRISEGEDQAAYYTASFVIRTAIFILILLGMVVFRDYFVDLNQSGLFWVLIIVVLCATINSQFSTAIGGLNKLGIAASTSLLNNFVRIGVQVAAVFLGYGAGGLVGGLMAGILVQIALDSFFIELNIGKFSYFHIKRLFQFSFWAFLISSGTVVFEYVAVIVLGYWLTNQDIGVYGVCWTFSSVGVMVAIALCNTLFVKVSKWWTDGSLDMVSASFQRAVTYALLLSLPVCVGGIILGNPLLYYLFGAGFAVGAPALAVLLIMRVFQSVQQILFQYLMAIDRAKKAFYITALGISLNLGLDLILIPFIGIMGAALAGLAMVLVSGVVAFLFIRKEFSIYVEKGPFLHILYSVLAMAVVVIVLRSVMPFSGFAWVGLLVAAGAGTYFGVLMWLDISLRDEILRFVTIRLI